MVNCTGISLLQDTKTGYQHHRNRSRRKIRLNQCHSTTIIIITTISLDHKEFLGDNIYSIANEKAGIIKQKTPVLLGPDIKETLTVFQKIAKEKNAPLYQTENSSSFNLPLPKYLLQNWEATKNAVSI